MSHCHQKGNLDLPCKTIEDPNLKFLWSGYATLSNSSGTNHILLAITMTMMRVGCLFLLVAGFAGAFTPLQPFNYGSSTSMVKSRRSALSAMPDGGVVITGMCNSRGVFQFQFYRASTCHTVSATLLGLSMDLSSFTYTM